MLRICLFACVLMAPALGAVIHLEKMNIDPTMVTVSGISSGAAMSTQMHVIHSATISGAGLFAGIPYYCAQNNAVTALDCMSAPSLISVPLLIAEANTNAATGNIDSTNNLKGSKVFIFDGTLDTVVKPEAGNKIDDFYTNYGAVIQTEYSINAEHCLPTDYYGEACNYLGGEYINNCNYNGAFLALNYLYGNTLTEPASETIPLPGNFEEFTQKDFFTLILPSQASMDSSGYIYIPSGCVDKSVPCKLHVAFHGCDQGKELLGDSFAKNTGYLQVAEVNNIIVLFPQAIKTILVNGQGCWDWWGYTNYLYATKSGNQISALYKMIKTLVG